MSDRLINISDFAHHIFWNYKKSINLNEDIVIQNVILYGDLDDYKKILKLVSKESFANIVNELEKTGKYKKRINFIKKVIL
ncbi:MAG: hypothetical protein M3R36_09445 [Bacteroidota bacterium]|nr:hypothetical protein [Bacteroidota bacterium]